MLGYYAGYFDTWANDWPVSFDGFTKTITIASWVTDINVASDLYSNWKEWVQSPEVDNAKFLPAFRTIGGDPTSEGQIAPQYFFLINGWKVVVDGHHVNFATNLYSEDGLSPFIQINGGTVSSKTADVGLVRTDLEKSLDYAGVVNVNIDGSSGTVHPYGTLSQPVNNISDALTIAKAYSINIIKIVKGAFTVQDLDVSYLQFQGSSPAASKLNFINSTNKTDACTFLNLGLSGHFNFVETGIHFKECSLGNITNFFGSAKECGFNGTVQISANKSATFYQCISTIPGTNAPTLDMNAGETTQVNVRGFSGGLHIINCDTPNDVCTVEYIAGKCHLDVSNVDGHISVRGMVKLNDQSNGSVVDTEASVTKLTAIDTSTIDMSGATVTVDETSIANAVWTSTTRTLTEGSGLDETQLHTALDNYTNKSDWGASTSDIQSIITGLQLDIETLIGDPTPDADVVTLLKALDSGLRQVLSNIADDIATAEATVVSSTGMRVTI